MRKGSGPWSPAILVIVLALVLPAMAGRAEPESDASGSVASPPPQGRQPLDFGDVVAGIELSVSRLDGRRAGSWKLFGREDQEVLLTLNLPVALAGPRGTALPIRFGREDGGFTTEHRPDQARGFDPQVPYLGRLGRGGHAYVFLGGTVSPPLGQGAGAYQGTVTLTVAFTAN